MNYGRRANGPQVRRTPQRRAADIAASVVAHRKEGREKDIATDYGVQPGSELYALIEQALMKHAA